MNYLRANTLQRINECNWNEKVLHSKRKIDEMVNAQFQSKNQNKIDKIDLKISTIYAFIMRRAEANCL